MIEIKLYYRKDILDGDGSKSYKMKNRSVHNKDRTEDNGANAKHVGHVTDCIHSAIDVVSKWLLMKMSSVPLGVPRTHQHSKQSISNVPCYADIGRIQEFILP